MSLTPFRIRFGPMPCQTFDNLCHLLSIAVRPNDAGSRDDALKQWTPDHWEAVIALASRHLVLPSIAARLAGERTCETIDPSLHAFFLEIHAGNTVRNDELLRAVDRFCELANQLGIRPILLKGAAHLATDLYADLGARYVSDIDVLVDGDERTRLHDAMKGWGYTEPQIDKHGTAFWDEHHHAPPLLTPDKAFAIEIHSDTLKEGGRPLDLDVEQLSIRAIDIERGEAHVRIPCIEDRVTHCIAHHQISHNDRFTGSIEMRDVLDLHFLTLRSPCSNEAWTNILQRFERAGYGNMITGFLNALRTMVCNTALGPCPSGGLMARWWQAHYLRHQRRSHLADPALYTALLSREWHRFSAYKAYRQQLRSNICDLAYWRHRWHNLLDMIWRR